MSDRIESTMKTSNESKRAATGRRNQQGRRLRRWIPRLGAVALIALLVAGFWPRPAPVETARAVSGRLRVTVNEEGKTRIRHRYILSAPVAGQLRRIPFKAGAEVKAGETVLAVIDPLTPVLLDARTRALAEAKRDVAAANFEKARTAHEFAVSELRRFQKLYAGKTVSIQELEPVQWRESAAAKDKAAAESALRQAEAELAEFANAGAATNSLWTPVEVKAPASGRVLKLFEESARAVTSGLPLVEIGDPGDLEVVIEALSRDGAVIMPGAKVELDQWGGNEPLEARVRLVEPAAFTKVSALGVEEQRVNVVADLVTPPDRRPGVGDNFRVEARIIVWETDRTLKVASGALFRRGAQWAVFVMRDGKARSRPVTAGRSSGGETQILDGLKEGDEVVVYPGDRIHDGQRVTPIKVSGRD
jgi:HlyD family secretion protein